MNRSILLVDDSPTIHKAIQIALKGEAYQLQWAKTLQEYKEKATKTQFEIVTVDFQFPDVVIHEFLAEVRRHQAKAKIILLCGTLDDPDPAQLSLLAPYEVLRKPFDKKSLIRVLTSTTSPEIVTKATSPQPPPPPSDQGDDGLEDDFHEPPPPPSGAVSRTALSLETLEPSVYSELMGAKVSGEIVLPETEDSGYSVDPYPSVFSQEKMRSTATKGAPPAPELDWSRVDALVKERLKIYCTDWVPEHLHKTLTSLIQDEMKQMNDEQWTKILTRALKEVVHEKFLDVAESVIRQELNQLLKDDVRESYQPSHDN